MQKWSFHTVNVNKQCITIQNDNHEMAYEHKMRFADMSPFAVISTKRSPDLTLSAQSNKSWLCLSNSQRNKLFTICTAAHSRTMAEKISSFTWVFACTKSGRCASPQ